MLEISILGPLRVSWDGEPVELPGAASRRLLAALVLCAGEWVGHDRLIDAIWGAPARGARAAGRGPARGDQQLLSWLPRVGRRSRRASVQ
jgi:hypothetical protein